MAAKEKSTSEIEELRKLMRQFWGAWHSASMTPELAARVVLEMQGGDKVRNRLEKIAEQSLSHRLLSNEQELEGLRDFAAAAEKRAMLAEENLQRCEYRTKALLEMLSSQNQKVA